MRQLMIAIGFVFLASASAEAQTTYEVDWYLQGAGSPFQSGDALGDDSACSPGTLPPDPGLTLNPDQMLVAHGGNLCNFNIEMLVQPFGPGPFTAKARAINGFGASGDSPASNPFDVGQAPVAPTGVVVQ